MKQDDCGCEAITTHGKFRGVNYCHLHDAALEMLEACRAALSVVLAVAPRGIVCAARDMLDDAIRKATGGSEE